MTAKRKTVAEPPLCQLPDGPDWTFELLTRYQTEIERVAKHYQLDYYPNQIEIITAEQMMDAYSSVGMPLGYNHWSYGKKFIQTEQNYKRGFMGLAYEIVINLQSLYCVFNGRKYHYHASAGDGTRLLWP